MKNIWKGIAFLTLCFFATSVQAQVRDERDKDKYKPGAERERNDRDDKDRDNRADKDMNERLSQNVYSRNPAAKDAVIVWDNTDEGYEGNYAVGDTKYIALYDEQGNYVETLTEREWDDNVPANVRRGFENSTYKSNKIERFWEVREPNREGYYLEFKDTDGKSRRLWSDRDGNFSEKPGRRDDNK